MNGGAEPDGDETGAEAEADVYDLGQDQYKADSEELGPGGKNRNRIEHPEILSKSNLRRQASFETGKCDLDFLRGFFKERR